MGTWQTLVDWIACSQLCWTLVEGASEGAEKQTFNQLGHLWSLMIEVLSIPRAMEIQSTHASCAHCTIERGDFAHIWPETVQECPPRQKAGTISALINPCRVSFHTIASGPKLICPTKGILWFWQATRLLWGGDTILTDARLHEKKKCRTLCSDCKQQPQHVLVSQR